MKRILIFSLTYHPYVGGAEVAIKEITDRLDPHEYAFDMITLRFDRALPRIERIGNVTVHRIGFTTRSPKVSDRVLPLPLVLAKFLFPLTSYLKALSLHRTHRYDIVWAMLANYAAFGALFFKWTHPCVPYFLELQDGNSIEQLKARQPFVRFLWPLYRRLYLKADLIKAISRFIEDLTREIGYTGPTAIVPNAVDTAKFSAPVPKEKLDALKRKFNKKEGDVFLFTASRLVLSRGVEDVIRALERLPQNVKFLVAGAGEDQEKLEAIAEESKVAGRVVFAGHVDHSELPALFKVSDIFVRSSLIEGFGNSFIEAFAAGIPVVATPVGGIPDFLQDGVTGLFCDVRDPESIARAVRRYLDDPARVVKIVANAKALAVQKYDWDIIARDMKERIFEPLSKWMRVLVVTPLYPPEPGGPATYSKLLEEGLSRYGIGVALVAFGDFRHLPKSTRHIACFWRTYWKARTADLVFALDPVSVGIPAMFAARLAGKPFVVKVVGDYAWEQGRQRFGITATLDEFVKMKTRSLPSALRPFRQMQRHVAKKARGIITPSAYLKNIVAAWNIPQGKIRVIRNAVRIEAGEAPAAVAHLPRPLIVSVGRLVPWKGFAELIEAVAILRGKGVNASLVIVGDGPERAALENKASAKLGGGFLFTGALSHAKTYGVMRSPDVFVLDSLYEGLSHTLIEAFMAGVPVVVSDVGGNREIVEDERNGLLVAPEDPAQLAEALGRVLSDTALRARLAAASRASGADFSVPAMLEETATYLRSFV